MNDWLERHRGNLFLLVLYAVTTAGMFLVMRRPTRGLVEILPPPTITPAPSVTPVPSPTPVILSIYVSGAVQNPDVYELPGGSRIEQAVQAAGGFTTDAAEAGVNLAQPLADGQQIYVPTEEEITEPIAVTSDAPVSAPASGGAGGLIDINNASLEELTELPGIGPAIAGRIVEYRESNGGFRTIQDIKQVRGIGDATFENLADLITVD